MAITKHVQHPKSSATTVNTQGVTVPRLPSSGDLLHGEIAVNYREGYETLSIRNSANDIVAFTPNNHPIHVSSGSAIVPGQIAMDGDEFYIFNEPNGEWQPVATNHVGEESELASFPVVQSPQFAYVADTGLVYVSQYRQGSQTWVPIATLDSITKTLATEQQPKIMVDYFKSDQQVPITYQNVLVFDAGDNKLKQYGEFVEQEGMMVPELLYEFDPSPNLIYYNKNTDKSYRWTGTAMVEILKRPAIETDETLSHTTGTSSVTISSNIFSANTSQGTVLYKMTPNGSANTASRAEHTTVFGAGNTAEGSTAAAAFGVGNALCGGTGSFVEGSGNTVSASAAHAAGIGTEAKNNGEFACGAYNISSISRDASGKTAFSIGFGTSGTRKNAFEVRMDGKVYINNLRTGNMVCLQDLLGM